MALAALGIMAGMNMVPQIMNLIKGPGDPYKGARKALERAGEFSAAAANPNSKMFKAAQAEAEMPLRHRAVAAANELDQSARRAQARGYSSGFVNSERRDEQRSKALMSAFMEASQAGSQQAQQRLSAGAQALSSYAEPATQIADRQYSMDLARQQQVQNLFSQAGAYGASALNTFAPNADQDISGFFRRLFDGEYFRGPQTVSK